jgi:HlyD family secretion protein
MSKKTKIIIASLVGAASLAAAVWAWQRNGRQPGTVASLAEAEVERRDIEVVAEAAGRLEPVQVVEVKSNASGEVLQVQADTGDVVGQGTLLAEIDPRDVQSAVDQAAADYESAQVRLTTARAEQRRAERLLEAGLTSRQEVEQTADATATARAALVRAQTALRLAREKRQDVTIQAPIAGTILDRGVEPGQIIASATSNVSGGTTLFQMADLSRMQVRANVDEIDIGQVKVGQEAEVTVEAYPGRSFPGAVAKIEPQAIVEQNVTMFPVLIQIDNREGLLKPGMNAEVTLRVARRDDAVAVPNNAVVNPRDARAAAEVLGVDPARLQAAATPSGAGPAGAADATPAELPAQCRELWTKAREAGGPQGLSAEERTRLQECRQLRGAGDGAPGRRSSGDAGAGAGSGRRPGIVFVRTPGGPEPRRVALGLSDWEFTEVLEGLEPGEKVLLVSVAQLQKRQQERSQRLRDRLSGPLGGGQGRSGGGAPRSN